MKKKQRKRDALANLLAVAPPDVLTDLILELAAEWPDVRRECFDFLKSHVSVSKALESRSDGENIMALWSELVPDLEELDKYGGGDYALEDRVSKLLYQMKKKLDVKKVKPEYRRDILNRVLPFIESGRRS